MDCCGVLCGIAGYYWVTGGSGGVLRGNGGTKG